MNPEQMSRDELVRELREAREALRKRDSLLAVASHDLRSPLSAIHLSANLLAKRNAPEERPQDRKSINMILRSTSHINRLIEDLLQAISIEAGTFSIKPRAEEVLPIVEESIRAFELMGETRLTRVKAEIPPQMPGIQCDRTRIIQAFSNLLANASALAAEPGTLQVRAWPRADNVYFAISDGRMGIPEGEIPPHLNYWKGSSEEAHGVRLGLYVARGIIEALGGHLWVDRQLGVGNTFYFSIPVARAVERRARHRLASPSGGG